MGGIRQEKGHTTQEESQSNLGRSIEGTLAVRCFSGPKFSNVDLIFGFSTPLKPARSHILFLSLEMGASIWVQESQS